MLLLPTLALVTLLVFSIIRLLPGDIVTLMMSEQGYASDKAKLEQMLGLDQPFYRQYVSYIGKALQGDLGVSFWTKEPVLDEILRRLPVSLELAVLAMFFGLLIAVPTGIFSAVRQDTWLDYLFRIGRHRRALRPQLLDGHRRHRERVDLVAVGAAHALHAAGPGPDEEPVPAAAPRHHPGVRPVGQRHAHDALHGPRGACARTTSARRGPRACRSPWSSPATS